MCVCKYWEGGVLNKFVTQINATCIFEFIASEI